MTETQIKDANGEWVPFDGMTEDEVKEILEHKERRDRFAMAALPSVVDRFGPHEPAVIARRAYALADAMIKARDA